MFDIRNNVFENETLILIENLKLGDNLTPELSVSHPKLH